MKKEIARKDAFQMKRFLHILVVGALSLSIASAAKPIGKKEAAPNADVEGVIERLGGLECLVRVRTDDYVVKKINSFIRSKRETERMIGRTATYFPLFDEKIKELGLPADIKYITVLETELTPSTVSHAGATGIWQLMTDVREEFGLHINENVDERLDLVRATEAALKDFKRMFNAYDDWELALAGYNCGPGRLGGAMKKARSRDFNVVKKFLPTETQNYIPKFVAFTYLMKMYEHHGLKPILPKLDQQTLTSLRVKQSISLNSLAQITGLPQSTIENLNPQFKQGYIPASENGYNLNLPRRVMGAVVEALSSVENGQNTNFNFAPVVIDDNLPKVEDDADYFKTTYTVGDNENIEGLAEVFNCSVYNIMLWNGLQYPYIGKGHEITLFMPRTLMKRV
ncbi:MAG: hypothetical protein RL757_3066 [Bacteroidota bacterium]|jgi:membrane-bound lytic murein transglycosylase D